MNKFPKWELFIKLFFLNLEKPVMVRPLSSYPDPEYSGGPESCHDAGFILRADERFVSHSFSDGWCPCARTITNLSWEKEPCLTDCVSRQAGKVEK
jgi:hypothetical protein